MLKHRQRIKILQESTAYKLETAVNDFITTLDRAPLNMTFGTFDRYYSDGAPRWPEHIAYITYIENE